MALAEFPKFPLWTDAYLGDTHHLTTVQHGAYLLLLISMWRSKDKSLPGDDASLASFSRLGKREWAKHKPVIMGFLSVLPDGRITQLRLLDEAKSVAHYLDGQSKRAKDRWLKTKGADHATASIRHSDGSATGMPPNPSTSPREEEKTPASFPTAARAEDADEDFQDRVLKAARIDVSKDISGKWFSLTQTSIPKRWLADLALSEAEAIAVVRDVMVRHVNGAPASLAYFDRAMAEFAGRRAAGLKPIRPPPESTSSVFGDCPEIE